HPDEYGVETTREERARLVAERAEPRVRGRVEERAQLLRVGRDDRGERRAKRRDADRAAERARAVEQARHDAAPAVADGALHGAEDRRGHGPAAPAAPRRPAAPQA